MSVATVETFEHDIADEIKRKEASAATIASSSGVIENKEEEKPSSRLYFLGGLAVLFMLVLGAGGYYIYSTREPSSTQVTPTTTQTPTFAAYFPTLESSLARFITETEKRESGFIFTLNAYNPVFAYVIYNEQAFFSAIAPQLDVMLSSEGTTTPQIVDITRANQNMRLYENGSSTLVYAFVDTSHLVIAKTIDELLLLRSSIVK